MLFRIINKHDAFNGSIVVENGEKSLMEKSYNLLNIQSYLTLHMKTNTTIGLNLATTLRCITTANVTLRHHQNPKTPLEAHLLVVG